MTTNVHCQNKSYMSLRLLPLLLAVGTFLVPPGCIGAEPSATASRPAKKDMLYYIPHTHWEGAVFKTREDYLTMGLPHILKVLRLLQEFPEYKFTLDQVAAIK